MRDESLYDGASPGPTGTAGEPSEPNTAAIFANACEMQRLGVPWMQFDTWTVVQLARLAMRGRAAEGEQPA